jgi:hypothetical protein
MIRLSRLALIGMAALTVLVTSACGDSAQLSTAPEAISLLVNPDDPDCCNGGGSPPAGGGAPQFFRTRMHSLLELML